MSTTLYDRVGGEAAIMAAVGILYEKLLDDELTRPFFEHLDIDAQVKKQVAFMTWAFAGPVERRGRDLRVAHRHLALTDAHFDAVTRHLAEALRELQIDEPTIAEVLSVIGATRDEVLNR